MIFNTVWVLMLTVCNPSQCLSQEVELFWTIEECYETKVDLENMPWDGPWKKIEYTCEPLNSKGI